MRKRSLLSEQPSYFQKVRGPLEQGSSNPLPSSLAVDPRSYTKTSWNAFSNKRHAFIAVIIALTTYHNYFWSASDGMQTYRRICKSESLKLALKLDVLRTSI